MIKKAPIKLYKGAKSLVEGMMVTLKYFFNKPVTMQYPEKKCQMSKRFRGVVALVIDEKTGKHRCLGCGNCVRICPNYSLSLECAADEATKKRYPSKFVLELDKCMFCGLCVEACPVNALEMNKEYEIASYTREGLKRSLLK